MGEHYPREQRESTITIAIVGIGVRGLCVLERLLSRAAHCDPQLQMRLHLVDPRPAQPPQYGIDQPDYLLLNHACGQISMFPSTRSVGDAPAMSGPSLLEWVQERGMRVARDDFTVGSVGREIEPDDNLPRRVFGEYLLWFYDHLRKNAPDNVQLIDHAAQAVDLQQKGNTSILHLDNADRVEADYVFVTVGQRPRRTEPDRDASSSQLIGTPYPLPEQFAHVQPSQTVAIAGLGLTATDAILALTVGRGGRFDQTASPARYVASGREPRIIAFSRSGLPYRGRPAPASCVSYEPVALTRSAIDQLKARTPRLDFDRDVLPLLLLELRVAYRRAKLLQEAGNRDAEMFLLGARAAAAEGHLDTWEDLPGPAEFDAEAMYHGGVSPRAGECSMLADGEAYQRSLETWMDVDIASAARGFEGSPMKAATEMCREVRDVLRYTVEFGGLTDASLDRFFSYHVEAINRLVIGPERKRSANMLTLLRSGVVSISLGPDPLVAWDDDNRTWTISSTALSTPKTSSADWLYRAYIDRLESLESDGTVVGAMARRGIVRRFKPNSPVITSADVDSRGHPISEDGKTSSRIWIFGLLAEGPTFYNGYLTSPERFERAEFDADRAVKDLLEESNAQ